MAAPTEETVIDASAKLNHIGDKSYHIFISYRVASEGALAEKICDKLQQLEVEREPGLRCARIGDAPESAH